MLSIAAIYQLVWYYFSVLTTSQMSIKNEWVMNQGRSREELCSEIAWSRGIGLLHTIHLESVPKADVSQGL